MKINGKVYSDVELYEELESVYKRVLGEHGMAHVVLCVSRAKRLALIEPLGDDSREAARIVAVALHDLKHAKMFLLKHNIRELESEGQYVDALKSIATDKSLDFLPEVIKTFAAQIAKALSEQEHPLTSLGKWVVSCTRWRYAYEMIGTARYNLGETHLSDSEVLQYIKKKWSDPWIAGRHLPLKIADDLFAEELSKVEQQLHDDKVKMYEELLRVDESAGLFNGTVSKWAAKFIEQHCELLGAVFGDFDLEPCDESRRHFYLCCTRTMFEFVSLHYRSVI